MASAYQQLYEQFLDGKKVQQHERGRPRHDTLKDFFDEDSAQYLDERYPSIPTTCDQFSYLVRKQYVLEMLDAIGSWRPRARHRMRTCGSTPATSSSAGGMSTAWISRPACSKPRWRLARALATSREVRRSSLRRSCRIKRGAFDAVMCIGVVSYVTDVPALLREVRRMLRPGGQASFRSPTRCLSPRSISACAEGSAG
jgi:SAM-dependent methyltransferase